MCFCGWLKLSSLPKNQKSAKMGLCQSEEEKKQTKQSRAIDKKMKEGALADEKVIKLLLLGAGESGKSTLLKQMRFVTF